MWITVSVIEAGAHNKSVCVCVCVTDPVSTDRYHCCHSAGVHSVALPWVHALQYFLSSEFFSLETSYLTSCVFLFQRLHFVRTDPVGLTKTFPLCWWHEWLFFGVCGFLGCCCCCVCVLLFVWVWGCFFGRVLNCGLLFWGNDEITKNFTKQTQNVILHLLT